MPGRCFRLTLAFDPSADHLRVEVTDAHGEVYPQPSAVDAEPEALLPGGRGLALVSVVGALPSAWRTTRAEGGVPLRRAAERE